MTGFLEIMRALADESRLRIMLLIFEMELAVGELALILDQSQPRVSRHVRILADAGLVERRREGSWVFLRPGPADTLPALRDLVARAGVATSDQANADRAQLAAVRTERARTAELYFDAHADKWDSIRSLHIAEAEVETAMAGLLAPYDIGRLLDIGTGTGRMIELFGPRARGATAIDKSPDMLRLARAKLSDACEVELLQGDFNALPVADASHDTVLLHQVLHYAQNPERVIAEAARVLAPSGHVMIADFAPHDREELRSVHAHARLGFSDAAISDWFERAAVGLDEVETLGGGELDVKIWLGRKNGPAEARPKRRAADNDRATRHQRKTGKSRRKAA